MAEAVVRLRVDASGATRALNGVQNQTNKLQNSFNGLRTAIAATGIGLIARNAVKAATDFEKLNQRLKILTKENSTYSESLKLAEEAQSKFGLSSIDALEGVTNLQARLAPLGSTMDEITAIFNGFNTAAILSGASAQEQAGAMRQLTQALGSGVLRGDEFNSISEQMSAVLQPIADQLGVNVGALRDMAAEGKITKDVVVAAFKEIENQGAGALKELIKNDPTMTFKVLANQTEKLSISVGQILAPAILDATAALTKIVQAVDSFVKSPIGQTAAIFTAIAVAAKGTIAVIAAVKTGLIAVGGAAGVAAIALNSIPFVAAATLVGAFTTKIMQAAKEQRDFNKALQEGEIQVIKSEFNKLFIERQKLLKRKREAEESSNKKVLQSLKKQLKLNEEALAPIKAKLDEERKISAETERQNKLKKDQEELIKNNEEAAKKLKDAMTAVGEEIESSIKGNLRDAITGAKSFGEAMTGVLNKIRDKIIDAQIDKLIGGFGEAFGAGASGGEKKGLGGFLGGFLGGLFKENGGPVKAGQPYIVGERQPELFVPRTSGTILPSVPRGGGGNTTNNMITVNVDASGSSVQGNGSEADQLGSLIAGVVQATIIDEQRAGGLLNR